MIIPFLFRRFRPPTRSPQFSPLSAFGCNLRSNFPATLFRFPLRTPEQASVSRLSRQAHGVADMRALLQAFARESAGMLLFLKNVERMSVFEWAPGQSEPKQVTGGAWLVGFCWVGACVLSSAVLYCGGAMLQPAAALLPFLCAGVVCAKIYC